VTSATNRRASTLGSAGTRSPSTGGTAKRSAERSADRSHPGCRRPVDAGRPGGWHGASSAVLETRCDCPAKEQGTNRRPNGVRASHVRGAGYRPVSACAIQDPTTFWLVDRPRHPNCDTCGAMVPAALMAFHVEWHATTDGHGTRFFEESPEEQPSLAQLLNVIAALRAVPKVSARPEFVATLRERLTELPHTRSSTGQGSPK
jgi:hypothetical protein